MNNIELLCPVCDRAVLIRDPYNTVKSKIVCKKCNTNLRLELDVFDDDEEFYLIRDYINE